MDYLTKAFLSSEVWPAVAFEVYFLALNFPFDSAFEGMIQMITLLDPTVLFDAGKYKKYHKTFTCVSSRHSRKCVTLLKLMKELIFYFYIFFLEHLYLDIFLRTLNCHHT